MAGSEWTMKKNQHQPVSREPLRMLSVVIPARNEEGCIASTVEHLHVELRLHGIEHEIIVVDDGSTDSTWRVLSATSARVPTLRALQNTGQHGFGRAIGINLETLSQLARCPARARPASGELAPSLGSGPQRRVRASFRCFVWRTATLFPRQIWPGMESG